MAPADVKPVRKLLALAANGATPIDGCQFTGDEDAASLKVAAGCAAPLDSVTVPPAPKFCWPMVCVEPLGRMTMVFVPVLRPRSSATVMVVPSLQVVPSGSVTVREAVSAEKVIYWSVHPAASAASFTPTRFCTLRLASAANAGAPFVRPFAIGTSPAVIVPIPVIGDGLTTILPSAAVIETPEVPAGVAHVPSPRQNVVFDAPVPELRFPTGRLPVTPVESDTRPDNNGPMVEPLI